VESCDWRWKLSNACCKPCGEGLLLNPFHALPSATVDFDVCVCDRCPRECQRLIQRWAPFPSTISPCYQNSYTALFWLFILLSWTELSCTTPKPHPLLFFSVRFCVLFLFFSFVVVAFVYVLVYAFVCACGCTCVCVRVRARVCVCLCVFSPAASVDYGSFADRCSTWLELLRLKAHTMRRGSVKTSRRTQSLAHSGDHTHEYWTLSHKQSHSNTHVHIQALAYTHTPLHACRWGAEHC